MMRSNAPRKGIPASSALAYDVLKPLLRSMYDEFRGFAKKKPDGIVSALKVAMANRLLKDVLDIVKNEPEAKYLELLDDSTLPQFSDVLILMSQFLQALDAFYERHTFYNSDTVTNDWIIDQ